MAPLVADLAAGAGGRAREGRDGGRMVVRLDLGQVVGQLFRVRIGAAGAGMEARSRRALQHGGVVGIRHHRAVGTDSVRLADHAEEGMRLLRTVDDPVGIEDLVAAMLGVRLGEHHQLDVGRVASGLREGVDEIVDLVLRQRQAHPAVGGGQRGAPLADEVHRRQRLRRVMAEQGFGGIDGVEHRLGHAIVQQRQRGGKVALGVDMEGGAALDARDRGEAALAGNFGRLRRPRRDGTQARRHQLQHTGRRLVGRVCPKQVFQPFEIGRDQRRIQLDEIPVFGRQALEAGQCALDGLREAGKTAGGKRGTAAQLEDFGHGWRKLRKA